MSQTVLIVDSGGRGAALVAAYGKSPHVTKIVAVPGNDLMQDVTTKKVITYQNIKTTNATEILAICHKEHVTLVDVAQDNALAIGLVDLLQKEGIPVVGPTQKAAQIEWDKAWSRNFMKKYHLPNPSFTICTSAKQGITFVKKHKDTKWFIKASGLAEGKGALPAENKKIAIENIKKMKQFGNAGKTYLVEQWLEGEEFSTFAICDSENFKIVGSAQDHKRQFTFDLGENTGGMGCSSNPLIMTKDIQKQVRVIIKKTLLGMQKEKRPFSGVLYVGGIVVAKKVFLIEFNARWGDPEAEAIIPGIETDFYLISRAVIEKRIGEMTIKTDLKTRIVITLATQPNELTTKRELFGLEKILQQKDTVIYGSRVKRKHGSFFVGSGRLLHLMAEGENILDARQKGYGALSQIFISDNILHFRTDIGWRDVQRHFQMEKKK